MDDALLVCLVEGHGDFRPNLQNLVKRQRTFRQAVGKSLALEIFHDQEVGVVLCADVVKSTDIGVLKRGNSFGFTLHALLQFRIRGKMRRQNFDGDGAVEASVLGTINLSHTARTEGRENFVRAEFGAGDKRHLLGAIIAPDTRLGDAGTLRVLPATRN
jgi:hypothetical protein